MDPNIGFREKRHFFRRKLSKIAENCDHNIDPWPGARTGFLFVRFFVFYLAALPPSQWGMPNLAKTSGAFIGTVFEHSFRTFEL
jgi:hypothetical protein